MAVTVEEIRQWNKDGTAGSEVEQVLLSRVNELEIALKPLAEVERHKADVEIDPHAMYICIRDTDDFDITGADILRARKLLRQPDQS